MQMRLRRLTLFRAGIALVFLSSALLSSAFPLRVKGVDTVRTSILIRDLRFGVDIVAENIDRSLIPASVMKSVTVASMLNLADTQERFSTPVIAEGVISDSVLDGNIVA